MLTKLAHMEVNLLISLCFTIGGVEQKGRTSLDEPGVFLDTRPLDEVQRSAGIH